MKSTILKLIEKKSVSYVYDGNGEAVLIKNMVDGKDYFLSQLQTKNEKTKESFKKAVGYEKKMEKKIEKVVEKSTIPIVKKSNSKPIKKSYKKASK